jgi:uncharacterized protein (DUF305 family)
MSVKQLRQVILTATTLALMANPAFAQTSGATPGTSDAGSSSMSHGPAGQAFMQEMHAMQQHMSSARMTGNADQDFVSMMKPHHQGAISMAKTELKYGKSAYLKRMARKIIKSQSHEIKEMDEWQHKHMNK